MRNIAIIALLLACVSLVDSAENMKEFDLMEQENMNMKDKAEIYLAGGCFWGTEHFLKQIRGVEKTEVGYANSQVPNPTYKEVCTGNTGAVSAGMTGTSFSADAAGVGVPAAPVPVINITL